jgi:hypothetical protein
MQDSLNSIVETVGPLVPRYCRHCDVMAVPGSCCTASERRPNGYFSTPRPSRRRSRMTMSATRTAPNVDPITITQEEIDHDTRSHLGLITELLERIGHGASAMVGAGYIEGGNTEEPEHFTELGWSMVDAAHTVAAGSAHYLYELITRRTTGTQRTKMLYKVQGFASVAACALRGLVREDDGTEVGTEPTWVAWQLMVMARDLAKELQGAGGAR